jgi:hypothetical protein
MQKNLHTVSSSNHLWYSATALRQNLIRDKIVYKGFRAIAILKVPACPPPPPPSRNFFFFFVIVFFPFCCHASGSSNHFLYSFLLICPVFSTKFLWIASRVGTTHLSPIRCTAMLLIITECRRLKSLSEWSNSRARCMRMCQVTEKVKSGGDQKQVNGSVSHCFLWETKYVSLRNMSAVLPEL